MSRPKILFVVDQGSAYQHLFRTSALQRFSNTDAAECVVVMEPRCAPLPEDVAGHPKVKFIVTELGVEHGPAGRIAGVLDKMAHVAERELLVLDNPDSTLAQNRHYFQTERGENPKTRTAGVRLLRALGLRWRTISRMAQGWGRYPDFGRVLDEERPDLVVYFNITVGKLDCLREVKRRGIPTLVDFPNWDQVTSKGPMSVLPDFANVWSEEIRRELVKLHGMAADRVQTIGVIYFDPYQQPPPLASREEFCRQHGIDPSSRIVVYAYGLLRGLDDIFTPTVDELERMVGGARLGWPAHLLVRAHPRVQLPPELAGRPGVSLQYPIGYRNPGCSHWLPGPEELAQRIATVSHSDVVVNAFSTMTLDASCLGRPVINLGYLCGQRENATQPVERFLRYNHLQAVREEYGESIVFSPAELEARLRRCLAQPEHDRDSRAGLLARVCGPLDGAAHRRWGEALLKAAATARG